MQHKQAIIQLQQIPEINNRGIISIEPSDKGLINYNFNVKTLSGTIHARVNRPGVLGVNRNHEVLILERIKVLNLSPKTIAINIKEGYLITEFVEAMVWTTADCYNHQLLLIDNLKKIHAVDMSFKLPNFLARLERYEALSLDQFDNTFKTEYQKTKQALKELGFFEVNQLLHFDLNTTNLIGTKKLTIIDWEFAGCGHPVFDLAIFIHYNKLEILKCETVVAYCHSFENGAEILRQSIKLASYMIKLWEAK